jgi:hypothetical protein
MTRLNARAERGFSMFLVIMAMLVTSLFVAAGFAAANGDLPVSGVASERKSAYAAAEAGLHYYLNRLQIDPDYWTKCDTGAAPNLMEQNPVNQVSVTDANRRWRTVPGSTDQYSIDLVPAPGYTSCNPANQASFVDMSTGTFKVRVIGRSRDGATRTRTIVATFRRRGFLNFVWLTHYENLDPSAQSSTSERTRQQSVCADKLRSEREGDSCTEISFANGDGIYGPMHTNDESFQVCGTPSFGRLVNQDGSARATKTDTIEVTGDGPDGFVPGPSCTANPTIKTSNGDKFTLESDTLTLPESNAALESVAVNSNSYYKGRTFIRLRDTVMDVTVKGVTTTGVAWPTSGVVYVAGDGACEPESPTLADYDEAATCGNVYVSGTYAKSLTIAAANDVIIKPTAAAFPTDADLEGSNDAMLGLIANNFVRVAHRVNRSPCSNYAAETLTNVTIQAAILSLRHSFLVDNYACGRLGTLTVNGGIVQKYRGVVGTGTTTGTISTGYAKNYWYDDRFRYRSPPYFLSPVVASWEVVRSHEFVKGS